MRCQRLVSCSRWLLPLLIAAGLLRLAWVADVRVPKPSPGAAARALRGPGSAVLALPLTFREHRSDGTRALTRGPCLDSQPALSPDGRFLVTVCHRQGVPNICLVDVLSGDAAQLTDSTWAKEAPVFAADGRSVVFAARVDGDWGIYQVELDGLAMAPLLDSPGSDERDPEPSADGGRLYFASDRDSGNLDIYRVEPNGHAAETIWQRLTTDPAPDRWPSVVRSGGTVAFSRGASPEGAAWLMSADGSGERRLTADGLVADRVSVAPDGSGIAFASQLSSGQTALAEVNAGAAGASFLVPADQGALAWPRFAPDGRCLLFARALTEGHSQIFLTPYTSPLWRIALRPEVASRTNCGWEAGVLALGWLAAWRATGEAGYLDLAQRWIDGCLATRTPDHVNDGLLGYAAIVVYRERGGSDRLAFARLVATTLLEDYPRVRNGALVHERQASVVWADTLLGLVPFLVAMEPDMETGEEAVRQVLAHGQLLQDSETGLFRHAWDDERGEFMGPSAWGRGNGWVILAESELLASMPFTHPLRVAVKDQCRRHALALIEHQRADGLWSTVVDRPDFYAEASATALIAYGLQRGLASGWLSTEEAHSAVRVARTGLWRQVAPDGLVGAVSAPTWPSPDPAFYNARPVGDLQLYGQGAALLLLSLPDL